MIQKKICMIGTSLVAEGTWRVTLDLAFADLDRMMIFPE